MNAAPTHITDASRLAAAVTNTREQMERLSRFVASPRSNTVYTSCNAQVHLSAESLKVAAMIDSDATATLLKEREAALAQIGITV